MTKLEIGKEYWLKGEVIAYTPRGKIISITDVGGKFWVSDDDDCDIEAVEAIPEREKVKIPKFVAEWVEKCKERDWTLLTLLDPTYFMPPSGVDDWLIDNNNQEVLARAWLDGYEIEKKQEPLGVLLVDMPEGSREKYYYLYNSLDDKPAIGSMNVANMVARLALKITEAEAKEKYPNFRWVSLEELENE